MIDDGVKGEGLEDDAVKVGDLAIHLLEALERNEPITIAPIAETIQD